jgi:F420-non-reducing hydrogenase iron-sulfur subunit
MNDFEPRIIAFLCNWCSYVAADAAGVARFVQKANVRVIRVFCSGMVDPNYVVKAFASGADGVLIAGCHPGDCHYLAGNIKALRRSFLLRKLRLEWIAASESPHYAKFVNEMVEEVRGLGPYIPLRTKATKGVA